MKSYSWKSSAQRTCSTHPWRTRDAGPQTMCVPVADMRALGVGFSKQRTLPVRNFSAQRVLALAPACALTLSPVPLGTSAGSPQCAPALFVSSPLSGAPSRVSSGSYKDALLLSFAIIYSERTSSKFSLEDEYSHDAFPLRFSCTDNEAHNLLSADFEAFSLFKCDSRDAINVHLIIFLNTI